LAKGLLLVTVEADELPDALREMAAASVKQFRVPCELRLTGIVNARNAVVATHLFRIAQEAVRNAARHAKARGIELRVSGVEDGIFMAVIDNGVGLPAPSVRGAGMGLRIMEHRAKIIGAEFAVRRPPSGGTVVECRWTNSPKTAP
jgi:signal transduction histidine kinase